MSTAVIKIPSIRNLITPAAKADKGSGPGFRMALEGIPLTISEATHASPARLRELYLPRFSRPVEDPRQRLEQQDYAEVRRGDTVIATISNSGAVIVPNSSPYLKLIRTADGQLLNGPELAQHMAETIARASGGSIVMADSAATQAEWLARPPLQWTVDYEALNAFIESHHRRGDAGERSLASSSTQAPP